MNPFRCIVCHSKSCTNLGIVSNKHIVRCNTCDLIQTKDFVVPNYRKYHRDSQYQESEYFIKFFFEKRYSILKPFLTRKGTVLEIGCSTGVFLDIFKNEGFETWGIEPSESAQYAISRGHKVIQNSFEKSKLPYNTFDLVVANHVLEHIIDPLVFLSKIHKLLKPKGILFIDVPNVGSLSNSIQKSHWPYYLPKEHISHFSKKTLEMVLSKSNFEVLYTKTKSGIFEVSNPLTYLFHELVSLKKNFFVDIIMIPENIASEIMDRGNSISVIAQKK